MLQSIPIPQLSNIVVFFVLTVGLFESRSTVNVKTYVALGSYGNEMSLQKTAGYYNSKTIKRGGQKIRAKHSLYCENSKVDLLLDNFVLPDF